MALNSHREPRGTNVEQKRQSSRGRGIQDQPRRSENSPPWQRRGGRAIKKNGPKAPCLARTGWFVQATARIYLEVERTTPVCAQLRWLRDISLMGAATPPSPSQGGEFRLILFFSFAANCLARSG